MDINELWDNLLKLTKPAFSSVTYDITISKLQPYSLENDHLILEAKNIYQKDAVNIRYKNILEDGLKNISHKNITIEALQAFELNNDKSKEKEEKQVSVQSRYVFESFISGENNNLAYSAAQRVAERPGITYNPLFIYGGVGLGKTHLMLAIVNYLKENDPSKKVLYCTSEDFLNDYVAKVRDKDNQDFRDKYRKLDVLLIDDIQFFAGKKETQEEFFNTFNALYLSNKQVVITSDQHPRKLEVLSERLTTRFEQGLTVDISKPDFETRAAILQKKAQSQNINLPKNVVTFIAENIDSNIRELEGALTRVVSFANLSNSPITLDLVQNALNGYIHKTQKQEITAPFILEIVGNYYGISVPDILSKKRTKEIAKARQVAMYLVCKYTDNTLVTIGKVHFGGRDHSTISHGCKVIAKKIEEDNTFKSEIDDIEKDIKGQ